MCPTAIQRPLYSYQHVWCLLKFWYPFPLSQITGPFANRLWLLKQKVLMDASSLAAPNPSPLPAAAPPLG